MLSLLGEKGLMYAYYGKAPEPHVVLILGCFSAYTCILKFTRVLVYHPNCHIPSSTFLLKSTLWKTSYWITIMIGTKLRNNFFFLFAKQTKRKK